MSFLEGFKKNINRAGLKIKQKTGASDRTTDSEFDEEYERFKKLEEHTEKLRKEAKGYVDSLRAMTAAQKRIQQTIDHFYDESAPMGQAGIEYKKVVDKLDEEGKDLEQVYRTTVMEPLGRFCSYFDLINEAAKRRQKKLLDYDSQRSKVRKLIDKPNGNEDRLPKAEQEANMAREMYESVNTILINDLPKVVDLRIPYLDPSFEALVKSQLQFSQTSYTHLNNIQQYFPQETDNDTRVDDVLQQMRDLTICGKF